MPNKVRGSRLVAASLGSFQRIDFGLGCNGVGRDVGCQIAIAVLPFHGRLGAGAAVPAGFDFGSSVATFTGFNDLMAESTVVTAAFGGHKGTLAAFANGLTNHGNYPPIQLDLNSIAATWISDGLQITTVGQLYD